MVATQFRRRKPRGTDECYVKRIENVDTAVRGSFEPEREEEALTRSQDGDNSIEPH